jgi:hypothetical protein
MKIIIPHLGSIELKEMHEIIVTLTDMEGGSKVNNYK